MDLCRQTISDVSLHVTNSRCGAAFFLSILVFYGHQIVHVRFDVPAVHVGMLVGEVSLLARLDAPLLHKRLVFLHITRTCDDLYLCCTYTSESWLDSSGQANQGLLHSTRCNRQWPGVST